MRVDIQQKNMELTRSCITREPGDAPDSIGSWSVSTKTIYSEQSTYTPPKSPNKFLACVLVSRVHWANPGPEEDTISDMGGKSFTSSLTM